ncbi:MAG: peptide chain release factor aRF-1 [Candidatus Heimdallarchaeota archaeon]|nr:peptide chain release factor aRF-1 [Candidatus Heimdallarchaeota archaeon]MBY8994240.1 peptide chain release factor aRF-1 [Candidatus Heimdallarchaeota archaeon]
MSLSASSFENYKIKQSLERIERKRSQTGATSLVSLYMPNGTSIPDVTQQLVNERGTAANIKSKATGKAVTAALSSILNRLKQVRTLPENGLVIFCGITQSGKVEYFPITPVQPISRKMYVCDTRFHTEYLRDQLEVKDQFALIVIDRESAAYALLRGNHMTFLRNLSSFVPGKHGKGGQSQRRIQRGTEILANDHLRRVGEAASVLFLDLPDLKGIVIGGPSLAKDNFIRGEFLDFRLRGKVMGSVDTGYTGEQGIRELMEKATDLLKDVRYLEEKELVQVFMRELGKDTGMVAYGQKEVIKAMDLGAVKILIISEELDVIQTNIVCPQCNYNKQEAVKAREFVEFEEEIIKSNCPECGSSKLSIEETVDFVVELGKQATETGARIEIISVDTEEGMILFKSFGGLVAILRYPIREM